MSVEYYKIPVYAMKCRLYPNKRQEEQLDMMLHGIHAAHNMILYNLVENHVGAREAEDKKNPGQAVHFPDFNEMTKASNLDIYREENPAVGYVPGEAITSQLNGLNADMRKAFAATGSHPIEHWGHQYTDKEGRKRTIGLRYYSKKKPRKSFRYTTASSNIEVSGSRADKIKIRIGGRALKTSPVKVRGWNKKLRFDDGMSMDFPAAVMKKAFKKTLIQVSKDNCGDWFVIFYLKNVFRPVEVGEKRADCIGVDVGEVTLAALSDGTKATKIENVFDHAGQKLEQEQDTLAFYNKKLSRSQGFKNVSFRQARKDDPLLEPSKSYLDYDLRYKRLSRKMQRQRRDYYHAVSTRIVGSARLVGIRKLDVEGMKYTKDKQEKDAGDEAEKAGQKMEADTPA